LRCRGADSILKKVIVKMVPVSTAFLADFFMNKESLAFACVDWAKCPLACRPEAQNKAA
jgi:hypothetical protein